MVISNKEAFLGFNGIITNPNLSQKTRIMGWFSWNNFRVNINEDVIKAQADAMIALKLKMPIQNLWDDKGISNAKTKKQAFEVPKHGVVVLKLVALPFLLKSSK